MKTLLMASLLVFFSNASFAEDTENRYVEKAQMDANLIKDLERIEISTAVVSGLVKGRCPDGSKTKGILGLAKKAELEQNLTSARAALEKYMALYEKAPLSKSEKYVYFSSKLDRAYLQKGLAVSAARMSIWVERKKLCP